MLNRCKNYKAHRYNKMYTIRAYHACEMYYYFNVSNLFLIEMYACEL